MAKRWISLGLILLLFIAAMLTGCTGKDTGETPSEKQTPNQTEDKQTKDEDSKEDAEGTNMPSEDISEEDKAEEDITAEDQEAEDQKAEDKTSDDKAQENKAKDQEKDTASEKPVTSMQAMAKLLPSKINYQWTVHGFAEYGHQALLKSITKSSDKISYKVDGTVADMSDGESKQNFSFTINYTVKTNVIVQEKSGKMLMDSDFNRIELIHGPLKKGTVWTQKVKDSNGKEVTLTCTITEVEKDGSQNVYTVQYKDAKSKYYEKRQIKEGVGVIFFEKLMVSGKESYPVSYSLYAAQTGYKNNLTMNQYLPKRNTTLHYNGLAEYGHKGVLKTISANIDNAVYEFQGVYEDGSGIADKFSVRYYFDYNRGTITEKVMSNTRANKKNEVNSKLHDLVILKLPISKGKTWSHKVTLDGKSYTMNAKIMDVTGDTVKIRYEVKGVPNYHDNCYFEERTFKIGYGMINFSNLMPGKIEISDEDAKDPKKMADAIVGHTFGYSLFVK